MRVRVGDAAAAARVQSHEVLCMPNVALTCIPSPRRGKGVENGEGVEKVKNGEFSAHAFGSR